MCAFVSAIAVYVGTRWHNQRACKVTFYALSLILTLRII